MEVLWLILSNKTFNVFKEGRHFLNEILKYDELVNQAVGFFRVNDYQIWCYLHRLVAWVSFCVKHVVERRTKQNLFPFFARIWAEFNFKFEGINFLNGLIN